jgi:hypothetical protein
MLFKKYLFRTFSIGLLVFLIHACTQYIKPAGLGRMDSMVKELSEIKGQYVWDNELKRYVYSEKQRIEEISSNRETEFALKVLVGCIDKLELSNSVIQEKKVVVGIICYEAIAQTVYYEPTTQDGDVAMNWPGNISPNATPEELRAAKRAWERVIATKSYIYF